MVGTFSNTVEFRSPPNWASRLQFETSFEDTKSLAQDAIRNWYPNRHTSPLELSSIEACVAIKNRDKAVVWNNSAFQYFFANPNQSSDLVVSYRTSKLSQYLDELISEGARNLEIEHPGKDPVGRAYSFRTFKRQLDEINDPKFFTLEISRPTACIGKPAGKRELSLMDLLTLFQSLDPIDQLTCRLDAKGESTRDIASRVGLSPRSIELRRKKMFELFEVDRPMELVRITIRLEEHGLLPD